MNVKTKVWSARPREVGALIFLRLLTPEIVTELRKRDARFRPHLSGQLMPWVPMTVSYQLQIPDRSLKAIGKLLLPGVVQLPPNELFERSYRFHGR